MFFQINVTPKQKDVVDQKKCPRTDSQFILVLAPFQPQTKIKMESTLNVTQKCYLNIKNTSNKPLKGDVLLQSTLLPHNVDLALTALKNSGYVLTGDIDAKSIADGHREKTVSVLWQIIHKFQAPRFHEVAITIQKWCLERILGQKNFS
ncbi:uncharacterized protein LOC107273768 isoform X1 [Cephus cinctus]|uniref:Uncharacterized protein LOC107273768 isoform X1 n=1 Tax=Cephus cinctus TaxID=211228 RepID=A0AAJ7CD01_CEPCN|nr:uncharacterized protein LOC107273768 isoform X1 [Cephus cinctus]